MGKLKDLKHIYETYNENVVNELNIGVSSSLPTISQSTSQEMSLPQEDENCSVCSNSPCNCNQHNEQEDSNVSMAKSEVFSILKSANELMNRLQNMSSLEPWQLSKIVKANDYINAVSNSVEYDEFEKCQMDMEKGMSDVRNGMVIVSQIKDMLAGEDIGVNEQVLKNVIFNIECLTSK